MFQPGVVKCRRWSLRQGASSSSRRRETGVASAKENGNPIMRTVERMLFDGARLLVRAGYEWRWELDRRWEVGNLQLKIPGWKKLGLFQ